MTKTLRLLSLAALLATGTATMTLAAGNNEAGQTGSQSVTGTQLGSPQQGAPATGSASMPTSNQYGNNNAGSPTYTYPKGSATGMSAQSGVVGPTGSTQPDATNPNRSSPTGGGADNGGAGGSSGGAGGTGTGR